MIIVVLYMSPFSYLASDRASARGGMGDSHYLLNVQLKWNIQVGIFTIKCIGSFPESGCLITSFSNPPPHPISDTSTNSWLREGEKVAWSVLWQWLWGCVLLGELRWRQVWTGQMNCGSGVNRPNELWVRCEQAQWSVDQVWTGQMNCGSGVSRPNDLWVRCE